MIEGLIQLKTGDAIRGIITHRAPVYRYLRVLNATAIEGRTEKSAKADGILWVPKANVLFIQELKRVIVDDVSARQG